MSKEQLYTDLTQQILTMALSPGEALDETRISEKYKLSRTPIREVFRQLAGEGYIQLLPNRGATVASMDHQTLRQFFMTAPMLYTAIGQLAAQNRERGVDALQTAQWAFKRAVEASDVDGMSMHNDTFHRAMGDLAGNPYLKPSYERLLIDHARINRTFYRVTNEGDESRVHEAAAHHDQMIAAIEAGDVSAMSQLVDEHWGLSRDHMERYVRPDPLQVGWKLA